MNRLIRVFIAVVMAALLGWNGAPFLGNVSPAFAANCNLSSYPTFIVNFGTSYNFTNADLSSCDFSSGAILRSLGASVFYNSTMTSTNLSNQYLEHASFNGAHMIGANLSNDDLKYATFNSGVDLTNVNWGGSTCPDGSSANSHGSTCIGHLNPAPPAPPCPGSCYGQQGVVQDGRPVGPYATALTYRSGPGWASSIYVHLTTIGYTTARVLFGPGPGCSGLLETATTDQFGPGDTHMIQVTGDDLNGGSGPLQPGVTYSYAVEIVTSSGGVFVIDHGGDCDRITVPKPGAAATTNEPPPDDDSGGE